MSEATIVLMANHALINLIWTFIETIKSLKHTHCQLGINQPVYLKQKAAFTVRLQKVETR